MLDLCDICDWSYWIKVETDNYFLRVDGRNSISILKCWKLNKDTTDFDQVFWLLTLNKFHTFLYYFQCWI